jgi:hypothetical protein
MIAFGRCARLTVYRPRPVPNSERSAFTGLLASLSSLLPNGIEIASGADGRGNRIQFQIEKRIGKSADTCTVTVSNLSEQTRRELQSYPLSIHLDAGYDDEYRRVFTGDLRWSSSTKRGTDWETVIQISDGGRALRHARVARSFGPGTPVRTALREAARSMGLVLPPQIEVAKDLEEQFAQGTVLQGSAADELTRLLAPYGYEWTIQDGTLQIYRDDETRPGQAIVIAPPPLGTLIESPEFAPPTHTAKPSKNARRSTVRSPLLRLRTLLYPQIVPGSRINVQSTTTDGIYKVIQVAHGGDTHGGDWTSDIEAKPL